MIDKVYILMQDENGVDSIIDVYSSFEDCNKICRDKQIKSSTILYYIVSKEIIKPS